MDTMEQEPEEIPMEQVLAEIRQMLSAPYTPAESKKEPVLEHKDIPAEPLAEKPVVQPVVPPAPDLVRTPPTPTEIPASPASVKPKGTSDCFLLTPAMRCDLPTDSELSESVQRQAVRVLNKLQQQSESDLSPALIEWLNAHLPQMVEKALLNRPNLKG